MGLDDFIDGVGDSSPVPYRDRVTTLIGALGVALENISPV